MYHHSCTTTLVPLVLIPPLPSPPALRASVFATTPLEHAPLLGQSRRTGSRTAATGTGRGSESHRRRRRRRRCHRLDVEKEEKEKEKGKEKEKNQSRCPRGNNGMDRHDLPELSPKRVREVFVIHVGGTRCVTSSTNNIMKIQARITLTVAFIRTCIFIFLVDVEIQ